MKNHSCFQPIIVLVLALLSFACTSPQQRAVLDSADSLMNAQPDSALTLLNALLPDTDQMSKGDLMRFHLLRTNAQNPFGGMRGGLPVCSPTTCWAAATTTWGKPH